jgi:quercetin dioxygenase-like cupin family protein
MVMKQDAESLPGKELALSLVEFPPGSAETPHTHPAELVVFVREGEVEVENEGKPNATYKTGEWFYVPPNKIHRVLNTTGGTSRTAAFFVTDKGKPLTTPAAK